MAAALLRLHPPAVRTTRVWCAWNTAGEHPDPRACLKVHRLAGHSLPPNPFFSGQAVGPVWVVQVGRGTQGHIPPQCDIYGHWQHSDCRFLLHSLMAGQHYRNVTVRLNLGTTAAYGVLGRPRMGFAIFFSTRDSHLLVIAICSGCQNVGRCAEFTSSLLQF